MTRTQNLFALVAACVMSAFSAPTVTAQAADVEPADSENDESSRLVTVAGLGEVMVQPDSLRTSVSIRARAATLAQARAEAGSKTRSVIQALERLRIEALQVRTVEITVTPILERREPGDETPPGIIGYEAESRLSVALRDVSLEDLRTLGPRILDTALGAGANVVGGVDFFLNEPRDAHRLALAAAVRDAEANAKVMAGAANVTLSELKKLSSEVAESFGYMQQSAVYEDSAETSVTGFPVEPGEIQVTTRVTASFLFTE